MSMYWRSAVAALAALGLLTTASPAQDHGAKVFRLGDLSAQPDDGDDDDTVLVYRRGWGGYRGYNGGGYRGYYGGYRGYYGGHRGYYSGYGGYYGGYRSYYAPRYFS